MRKNISIPKELNEEILDFAIKNGWSYSQTICYLAWLQLKNSKITFDVDKPKRRHNDHI